MMGLFFFFFFYFQKTDITLKKAHNYLRPPCWHWESVPHNCLQGYFKLGLQTLGWPKCLWSKRAAVGKVSTNFSLIQAIFLKVVFYWIYQVIAQNDSWVMSPTPWRGETQLYTGMPTAQLEPRKTSGNDPFNLSFTVTPRDGKVQWAQPTVPR